MARNRTNHPSGDIGIFRLLRTSHREATQCAYTLTELLVVVMLLGLAATIAMPSQVPGEGRKLDLAATELANGMRFARSEAMRLGVARGFFQQVSSGRIRVFSLDTGSTPATAVYDVYHPIDKQIYDRQFQNQPYAFTGELIRASSFRGTCNSPAKVYFNAGGIPWCLDPDDVLVDRYDVTLTLGSSSRLVTLHGITGRVTIQ
jgi:prepilin-type N-terminal cleavage/methylation domain-containing protein